MFFNCAPMQIEQTSLMNAACNIQASGIHVRPGGECKGGAMNVPVMALRPELDG